MDEAAVATVRAELVRARDDARRRVRRGAMLLALVPCILAVGVAAAIVLGGHVAFGALAIAGVYAIGGGFAGLSAVTDGFSEQRKLTRQLRDIDEVRGLPEARLVIR